MTSTPPGRRRHLHLLWLLPLAALLRVRGLTRESLWLDEINELMAAAHPLAALPGEVRWHASPPLDYVVTHFWQYLGWTEAVIRLPSLIWSVGSVALLYHAARRLGFERAALPASLLLALSVPSIAFAQEARMYSLFTFCTVALLLAVGILLTDPDNPRGWALTGLAAIFALYTHYFGFLLLLGLAVPILLVVAARRSRRVTGFALATGATVALLYLPWLPFLYEQYRVRQGALFYALPRDVYWDVMLKYVNGGLQGGWIWFLVGTFVVGLTLVTLRSWERGLALAAFSVAPLALAFWVPPFSATLTPRNLLFVIPAYQLGIAIGLTQPVAFVLRRLRTGRAGEDVPRPISRAIESVAGVAVVLALVVWPARELLASYDDSGWWMKSAKEDWRGAALFLDAQAASGDIIATDNRYTRYLLTFYLDREALHGLSLDPYVQNIAHVPPTAGERFRVMTMEAFPAVIRNAVEGAGTLWLVAPGPVNEKLLGIDAREREEVGGFFGVPIVRLQSPRILDQLELGTSDLSSVIAGEWSTQLYLRDGVFFRWLGIRGDLRLPVWSSLGTTASLRFFVPPALAGTTLRFGVGEQDSGSHIIVSGWQELVINLHELPRRDGWVDLWVESESVPAEGDVDLHIGNSGVLSPVPIVVESSTHERARFADIFIDGELYSWTAEGRGYARGYNLVAIDPGSGAVVAWDVFDTHGEDEASDAMVGFLDALPTGTIVAGAVMDDGSSRLSEAAYGALAQLGCEIDIRGQFRAAHAFVGAKGAPSGSALEDGLSFQGKVVLGEDTRRFSVGLSSMKIALTR